MAAAKAPKQSAPRRRWPAAEKRRIVELTLSANASIGAIAREHGLNPSSLSLWKRLYRAGRLDAQAQSFVARSCRAGKRDVCAGKLSSCRAHATAGNARSGAGSAPGSAP